MEPGIDILNCGTGHTEVRFNNDDPIELERAKRIIKDMLKRGYVLFIEGPDKKLIRVNSFNPDTGCYIIADLAEPEVKDWFDEKVLAPLKEEACASPAPEEPEPEPEPQPEPTKGRKGKRKAIFEVPVQNVRTTAIARSAGG